MKSKKNDDLIRIINEATLLKKDLKKLKLELKLQKNIFYSLINHLPSGIMIIDKKNNIVFHNDSLDIILNIYYNIDGINYKKVIKNNELKKLIDSAFNRHIYKKRIKVSNNVKKDIDVTILESKTFLTFDYKMIVILHDLTSINKIEQIQMDFVSNVSHELKTPVTAINGFAETLLDGAKDDPKTNEQFINIIFKESKRLNQLIQDILSLSRLDNNYSGNFKRINLFQDINQIKELLKQQLLKRNIHVYVNIPHNVFIKTDIMKFDQIVKNLLVNAIFYNHKGGCIWINFYYNKNYIKLIFKDTGIGIAKEQQSRIFERFYRVDTSRSKKSGGTGLGLSIVKNAVKSLNGKIELYSKLGIGSKFTITLPNLIVN